MMSGICLNGLNKNNQK